MNIGRSLLAWALSLVGSFLATRAVAQPQHSASAALYQEIAAADSAAFAAFNAHDTKTLMTFFTTDVEFYNDGGTRTSYAQTQQNFSAMFQRVPDLQRQLVKGSLAVYPVPGYGAIATGAHRFCHQEKGRADCGTTQFTTIWQLNGSHWQMARVVSYGH